MTQEDKILGLIGFCSKTRSFVYGKDRVRSYIKNPNPNKFVIIAADCGETVKDDVMKSCEYHKVPFILFKSKNKADLAQALGKEQEEVSVIGLEDFNIIKGILKIVNSGGEI